MGRTSNMSRYYYEIDEGKTLRIWDTENPNDNNAPFLLQPQWPDGTDWESAEQVNEWAELFIYSMENPELGYQLWAGPEQEKPGSIDQPIS